MTQGGQYLRCDVCNDPRNDFSVNLPWNRYGETIAAAKQAGWIVAKHFHPQEGKDICPACQKKVMK